jgi:poly-gamma-glutamate system protein
MVARRLSRRALAMTAGLSALLLVAVVMFPGRDAPVSADQQSALDLYRQVTSVLYAARSESVDPGTLDELRESDPGQTGLVGVEWSYLVTTQGDLDAKRASARPEWVLMFSGWFREAGVRRGDVVAVGCSASFPALLYALRCAAQPLGVRVRAVASLTASNYGATVPGFDLWEMEETILGRNLLPPALVAITPGGDKDAAADLDAEAAGMLRRRLEEIGTRPGAPEVVWPESMDEARALRERLLLAERPALFANIGGNSANMGTGRTALLLPRGLIRPYTRPESASGELPRGAGVIHRALASGIPCLHLLDVRSLLAARVITATGEGVHPPRGTAPVYARTLAAVAAIGLMVLLFLLPRERCPATKINIGEEN